MIFVFSLKMSPLDVTAHLVVPPSFPGHVTAVNKEVRCVFEAQRRELLLQITD